MKSAGSHSVRKLNQTLCRNYASKGCLGAKSVLILPGTRLRATTRKESEPSLRPGGHWGSASARCDASTVEYSASENFLPAAPPPMPTDLQIPNKTWLTRLSSAAVWTQCHCRAAGGLADTLRCDVMRLHPEKKSSATKDSSYHME